MALQRRTNVKDNFLRCFDHFMISDLGHRHQAASLETFPLCLAHTSILVNMENNGAYLSRCASIPSSGCSGIVGNEKNLKSFEMSGTMFLRSKVK